MGLELERASVSAVFEAPFLDRKFSAMNPCLLWSAANAHSLPEDLRTDLESH